jgi:hypothetical protein
VLTRVVEFLTHRAENPFTRPKKPLRDRTSLAKNNLEEWYATFIEGLDMKDVFDLLRAGDFLRIEDLMDLAAARIARQYLRTRARHPFLHPIDILFMSLCCRVEPMGEEGYLRHWKGLYSR